MIQLKQQGTDRRYAGGILLLCSCFATTPLLAASQLSSPAQPLVSAVSPAGWSFGVMHSFENRELQSNGTVIDLDGNRTVAEVGVEVLPFMQLAGQAGRVTADLDSAEGENGLAWGLAAHANLGELVLDASPEIGRRRWLGAHLDLAYRSSESNLPDRDFSYDEFEILPSIVYLQNRRGTPLTKAYHADGFGLRAGLIFNTISGDLGQETVEENRNFGGMLGFDVRWRDGWVGTLQADLFGSNDRTLRLGLLYHF